MTAIIDTLPLDELDLSLAPEFDWQFGLETSRGLWTRPIPAPPCFTVIVFHPVAFEVLSWHLILRNGMPEHINNWGETVHLRGGDTLYVHLTLKVSPA